MLFPISLVHFKCDNVCLLYIFNSISSFMHCVYKRPLQTDIPVLSAFCARQKRPLARYLLEFAI